MMSMFGLPCISVRLINYIFHWLHKGYVI